MADTPEEPTVTLTVTALMALLATKDRSVMWLRLQQKGPDYNTFRDLEITDCGEVGGEKQLLFRLRKNGTEILKEARVSTADIFGLMENVHRIINDKLNGE